MSFNRPPTGDHNHLERLSDAYTALGVTEPSRSLEVQAMLDQMPGVAETASVLAVSAFTASDPHAFLADAVEQIAQAQAVEALKKALAQVGPNVRRNQMPTLLAQAVLDLAEPFGKLAKRLATAAAKLDTDRPLTDATAVRDDTTREVKAARSMLAVLARVAAMHQSTVARDVHPALSQVLPLLELPQCEVEILPATFTERPKPMNPEQLAGTVVVRELIRSLEHDTDTALLGVARGEFEGIRFRLADVEGMRARTANATRAARTRRAKPEERGLLRMGA